TRGNDIIIKASVNVVDETLMDVKTYVDDRVKDEQSVAKAEDLQANDWVTFSGNGVISATAGTTLANGTNGTVINSDYTEFLSACETQLFNVVAYPVADPTLKVSFATWVKKLRDDEGKKIVGVLADYNADYEGVINVKNGVILNDGTTLDALGAVPWVAGATAGASIVQSLTYSAYEGAVDANPRLSNLGYINGLLAGQFVFQFDGEKTKVEQDINSLHTYDQTKNQRFSKNRVIRVLDNVNNDLLKTFSDSYIGKIDNNADGQALLKQAVVDGYLQTLQDAGAIQKLDKDNDFIIDVKKSVGDEVWAKVCVQPVDSMEKIYFDVVVR
ncbi:phage tail sheath family protein, partial [Pelosinus baikalensis]